MAFLQNSDTESISSSDVASVDIDFGSEDSDKSTDSPSESESDEAGRRRKEPVRYKSAKAYFEYLEKERERQRIYREKNRDRQRVRRALRKHQFLSKLKSFVYSNTDELDISSGAVDEKIITESLDAPGLKEIKNMLKERQIIAEKRKAWQKRYRKRIKKMERRRELERQRLLQKEMAAAGLAVDIDTLQTSLIEPIGDKGLDSLSAAGVEDPMNILTEVPKRMPRKKSNLDNTRTRKARLQRALRALESEEETAARNAAQRMRTAEIRSRESLEQREKRLRLVRTARHQNIARFRELERSRQRTRRALIRGAFFQLAFDDPYVNYAPRAIGVMGKCHCHAVKFRSEACVCCASEEIVLSLPTPVECLKSSLSVKMRGDGEQFLKKKRERQRRYRERNREVLREREKERRRQNRTDTRRKSKRISAKNSAANDSEITNATDSDDRADLEDPKAVKIEVPESCGSEEDSRSSLEGGVSPRQIKKERSHTDSESARVSTEDCGGYGVNALRVADLSSVADEIQEPPLEAEILNVTPEEIDLKVEEIVYEASSDSSESTEEDTYILPHAPWELENGELSYEEPQHAFFIKTEVVECAEDDQGFGKGSEKDWRVPVGVKEDEERVSFERHKVVKTYGRRKK